VADTAGGAGPSVADTAGGAGSSVVPWALSNTAGEGRRDTAGGGGPGVVPWALGDSAGGAESSSGRSNTAGGSGPRMVLSALGPAAAVFSHAERLARPTEEGGSTQVRERASPTLACSPQSAATSTCAGHAYINACRNGV